jgi:hypothetical protein
VEPSIQKQLSLLELLRKGAVYLYANSRPQYHAALYVLMYAALWIGTVQVFLFILSLTPWFSLVLDYELIGIFVGCVALAELARGHAKHWHGHSVEDWCYVAMPIGGAVLGATFAGLLFLISGKWTWSELMLFPPLVVTGAGCYTLLGWLFHLQDKQKAKQLEAGS